jgi:hypothetical protein
VVSVAVEVSADAAWSGRSFRHAQRFRGVRPEPDPAGIDVPAKLPDPRLPDPGPEGSAACGLQDDPPPLTPVWQRLPSPAGATHAELVATNQRPCASVRRVMVLKISHGWWPDDKGSPAGRPAVMDAALDAWAASTSGIFGALRLSGSGTLSRGEGWKCQALGR